MIEKQGNTILISNTCQVKECTTRKSLDDSLFCEFHRDEWVKICLVLWPQSKPVDYCSVDRKLKLFLNKEI